MRLLGLDVDSTDATALQKHYSDIKTAYAAFRENSLTAERRFRDMPSARKELGDQKRARYDLFLDVQDELRNINETLNVLGQPARSSLGFNDVASREGDMSDEGSVEGQRDEEFSDATSSVADHDRLNEHPSVSVNETPPSTANVLPVSTANEPPRTSNDSLPINPTSMPMGVPPEVQVSLPTSTSAPNVSSAGASVVPPAVSVRATL